MPDMHKCISTYMMLSHRLCRGFIIRRKKMKHNTSFHFKVLNIYVIRNTDITFGINKPEKTKSS